MTIYSLKNKPQTEHTAHPGKYPQGFFKDASKHKLKLVVDHCHSSGKVRGLLCHNCNRALGLFQDSMSSLTRAIEYLKV